MMREFRANIRGLRTNFFDVYAHTHSHKPAVLALSETQVVEEPSDLQLPGYSLVPLFFPHSGLAIYIRRP